MNKDFLFLTLSMLLLSFGACKKEEAVEHFEDNRKLTQMSNIFTEASSVALYENDSVWSYEILLDKNKKTIQIPKNKLPLQNIAVLSASSIGYLEALDELKSIKGVYDAQWIYSKKLQEMIKSQPKINQGNVAAINLEKILALNPDAVIGFSDPNMAKTYQMLEKAGILVIYVDEYNEKTPLGKSEFIKLYGILTNKQKQADSLYQDIQTSYLKYKEVALKQNKKPTVFADIMRGDIWYMPGGSSFAALYFQDAGADYLWSDNINSGSVKLNFEQVFDKAAQADYWMNAADLSSLTQLQQAYINHDWFDAFKNENVYSLSKRMNEAGSNDYFETGSVRADWVLKDLVHVFHPELLPEHVLYFYQELD